MRMDALDWDVVLINSAFTIFQLLFQRAVAYQTFPSSAFLVVVLNIGLVGFSVGMILHARFPAYFGRESGAETRALGFVVLCALFLIQQKTMSIDRFPEIIPCVLFLASSLFGSAVAPAATRNILSFILAMTVGSVSGIVAYYAWLAYLPFPESFWLVSMLPCGVELRRRSSSPARAIMTMIGLGVLSGLFLRLRPNAYDGRIASERYYSPSGVTEIFGDSPRGPFTMLTDRTSPTPIAQKGRVASMQLQARIPYLIHRSRRVLVIGAGGGQDLAAALYYGASQITGLEINAERIRLMRGRFAAASNGLYLDPRVRILEDDARHAIRYLRDPYDLIVLQRPWTSYFYSNFLIDISAPLMTEEALAEYWRLLKPDGLLFIALPYTVDMTALPVVDSLRALFSPAFLREHLAVLDGEMPNQDFKLRMLIVLLSKVGFSKEQRAPLSTSGFETVYFPGDLPPAVGTGLPRSLFSDGPPRTFKDGFSPHWFGPEPPPWVFLLVAALMALPIVGRAPSSLGAPRAVYVVLGVLYFWLEALLILHASLLLGNVPAVYYLAVPIFILFGGFGYVHSSRSTDAGKAQLSSLCLMIGLAAVGGLNLFERKALGPSIEKALVMSVCAGAGYLSAYPFGYLISREKERLHAFAWDGYGMALAYPALVVLLGVIPREQLLLQLAGLYGLFALWIPRSTGLSSRAAL
ncbi:MAG: spermidine synthase [Elusimicrobiota bacterium]